jgi:hypothetical protein
MKLLISAVAALVVAWLLRAGLEAFGFVGGSILMFIMPAAILFFIFKWLLGQRKTQ